jgi:hypothetical protein
MRENLGMAIEARMPMTTTTMSNSINVKPDEMGRFNGAAPWPFGM